MMTQHYFSLQMHNSMDGNIVFAVLAHSLWMDGWMDKQVNLLNPIIIYNIITYIDTVYIIYAYNICLQCL